MVVSAGLVACGSDDTAGKSSASASSSATPKCGLGTGKKATGEPIKLGGLFTKIPGIDFTDIKKVAQGYFDCVNDNGGINGRPIDYVTYDDKVDPQAVTSLATRLVENDKVLAIVGSTSILDCTVNHKYYEKNNMYLVVAGVPTECFTTPNIAAVNMGPTYSAIGAAQYLLRQGAKSMIVSTSKQPGAEAANIPPIELAKSKGITKTLSDLQDVPINDAASVALKFVQAAGEGGGVLLNYTPPEALKILQAATQQGIIDKVHWACVTSCNDAALAKAVGPEWDGKLGVNAELVPVDSTGPDNTLYRSVSAKYAPGAPLGNYGQMGFLAAKIVSDTLMKLPAGDLNRQKVNEAIHDISGYKTDILCKPWYFGDLPAHVPNNADRTIVTQGGKFAPKEGCFDIAAVTPQLKTVRAYEKQHGIG
jgi:branched-chain amino acid transport system substrate-binding protein